MLRSKQEMAEAAKLEEVFALDSIADKAKRSRPLHLRISYRDRIARNLESAECAPWVSPSLDRKYGRKCIERGPLKAWKWQREAARSKRLYGALGKTATSTCEAVMEGLR